MNDFEMKETPCECSTLPFSGRGSVNQKQIKYGFQTVYFKLQFIIYQTTHIQSINLFSKPHKYGNLEIYLPLLMGRPPSPDLLELTWSPEG